MLASPILRSIICLTLALSVPIVMAGCSQESSEEGTRKEKSTSGNNAVHRSATLRKYLRDLQEHVKAKWLPESKGESIHERSGSVTFSIDRSGAIKNLEVLESSGNKQYDNRMLETMRQASPLPAPPATVGLPRIDFSFDMRVLNSTSITDDTDELVKIIEDTTKILNAAPRHIPSLKQRASACLALDQKRYAPMAISDLNNLLELKEADAEIYDQRSKAQRLAGDLKQYLVVAREALAANPDQLEAKLILIDALEQNNFLDEAMTLANQLVEKLPNYPDTWAARAYVYVLQGDYLKARLDIKEALAIDPENSEAYSYLGDAEVGLKQFDRALRAYSRAIKYNPDDQYSYLRRARLYNELGRYAKAIVDATQVIEIDSDNGEAYFYRAFANNKLGLKSQAVKDTAKANQFGFKG